MVNCRAPRDQGGRMFGHQNDQQDQDSASQASEQPSGAPPINNDVTTPTAVTHDYLQPDTGGAPATTNDPGYVPPAEATFTPPAPVTDPPANAATDPASVVSDDSTTVDANDLLDIKQQALTELSPLVGHLEQTPVEKFRTTMMMIQASDNQSLIKDAYAAAQTIEDEKTRAQALLDVINEINYFTQHHDA